MPSQMAAHAPPIRNAQIILVALACGVLAFTGVASYLRLSGMEFGESEVARLLPLLVVVLAACEIPVYLLLRKAFLGPVKAARAESLGLVEQGRIPMQLQTLAILGAALAEGVGLLGVVTLLVGGSWYVLAAPLLSVLAILALMPTRARLERMVRG